MADISLVAAGNGTDANKWSKCKAGGPPAAEDTIYLTNTGATLALDGTSTATYTCTAVRAITADMATRTHGHITITNSSYTPGAGPVLDFEMEAGDTTMLAQAPPSYIHRIGKIGATAGRGGGGIIGGVGAAASQAYGVEIQSDACIGTVTAATGGGSGNSAAIYMPNSGTVITTVSLAAGGTHPSIDANGAVGILMYNGTLTNVEVAVGGSAPGAYGIKLLGSAKITNPVGTAKGGTVNFAYAIHNASSTEMPSITNFDPTGFCAPVGVLLNLPANAVVGSADAAGTGIFRYSMTRRR